MILLEQLDKVLKRFYASEFKQVNGTKFVTHDIKRYSNGFLVKLGNNFTCVLSKFSEIIRILTKRA